MLLAEIAAALACAGDAVESPAASTDGPEEGAMVLSWNAGSGVATGVHGELFAGRPQPVRDLGEHFSFYRR